MRLGLSQISGIRLIDFKLSGHFQNRRDGAYFEPDELSSPRMPLLLVDSRQGGICSVSMTY